MRSALTLVLLLVPATYLRPLDDDMLLYWRKSADNPCEPFTTYMIDCNKCVCAADGVSYCTKMSCMNKPEKLEEYNSNEND